MSKQEIRKLNKKIEIEKIKLNFLKKILDMIKNDATGFDIAYEIEKDKKSLVKLKLYSTTKIERLKRIGNSKISEGKISDKVNYRIIMDYLMRKTEEILKEIEYLEYKNLKPDKKDTNALLVECQELKTSVENLDNKLKQWKE